MCTETRNYKTNSTFVYDIALQRRSSSSTLMIIIVVRSTGRSIPKQHDSQFVVHTAILETVTVRLSAQSMQHAVAVFTCAHPQQPRLQHQSFVERLCVCRQQKKQSINVRSLSSGVPAQKKKRAFCAGTLIIELVEE